MMNQNTETPMIHVDSLCKRYDEAEVLHRICFEIGAGHIVGVVGPNSSGKSTLLRHLVGLTLPSGGSCQTFGVEASRLSPQQLSQIGYVHQEAELLGWMRCKELIRYTAAHYPTWNLEIEKHLIDLFQLDLHKKVCKMSPGQRQMLSILLASCYEPKLLILDEPAAALDPVARIRFLELLLEMLHDGDRTIVISSHILSDIEKIIDHVLILDDGNLREACPFDELLEAYVRLELISVDGDLPPRLPFSNMFSCQQQGPRAIITMKRPDMTDEEIGARLNCQVMHHPLSFEEIYPLTLAKNGRAYA